MSRLTRDGTADLVSRDQIIRHVRGQGDTHFPCSADHESRIGNLTRLINHIYIYIHTYIYICDDHTYYYAGGILPYVWVADSPGSSEVPRNPLTHWDVSSISANGIFLTKKLKKLK